MQPARVKFQHTAARRRLATSWKSSPCVAICFNTQPPEGGWFKRLTTFIRIYVCFNTQPPEGGWLPRSIAFSLNY